MQVPLLTNVLLFLLFHLRTAVLAAPENPTTLLAVRQAPAPSASATPIPTANPQAFGIPNCQNYATIANLSTIGTNSSYRAAFLQSSPQGTYASAAILNNAMAQIPLLINDPALNQQCGNLTAVALHEAATNFTKGIVAQFSGLPPPSKGFPNAMVILFLGIVYLLFMGILFHSL